MLTAAELMTPCPVTVREDDPLHVAASLMAAGLTPIRHVPVLREGKVVGIISERDVLRAGNDAHLQVADAMTRHVHWVWAHTPLRRAIQRLVEHRVGALPVLDREDTVLGILSAMDVLAFAHRLVAQVDELHASGRRGVAAPAQVLRAMAGMLVSSLPDGAPMPSSRRRRRSSSAAKR